MWDMCPIPAFPVSAHDDSKARPGFSEWGLSGWVTRADAGLAVQ